MAAAAATSMTGTALLLRSMALLVIAALCWALPGALFAGSAAALMILTGQAHFSMTYLYHYRTGRMTRRYLLRLGAMMALLFGAFALWPAVELLALATAAYFLVHFLYDERHLMREAPDAAGWLRALPTLVVLAGALAWQHSDLPPAPVFWASLAIALGLVARHGYGMWRRGERPGYACAYFLLLFLVSTAFCGAAALLPAQPGRDITHFVVITHVANWYLSYFSRFSDNRPVFNRFLVEVVAINGALAILFVLFYRYLEVPAHPTAVLGFYFLEPYFYLWALLHYFVTFRPTDLRNWIPHAAATSAP